jgi:hypothetical protein
MLKRYGKWNSNRIAPRGTETEMSIEPPVQPESGEHDQAFFLALKSSDAIAQEAIDDGRSSSALVEIVMAEWYYLK